MNGTKITSHIQFCDNQSITHLLAQICFSVCVPLLARFGVALKFQYAKQMRAVLGQQEKPGDGEEADQHPVDPRIPLVNVMLMFFMSHGTYLAVFMVCLPNELHRQHTPSEATSIVERQWSDSYHKPLVLEQRRVGITDNDDSTMATSKETESGHELFMLIRRMPIGVTLLMVQLMAQTRIGTGMTAKRLF